MQFRMLPTSIRPTRSRIDTLCSGTSSCAESLLWRTGSDFPEAGLWHENVICDCHESPPTSDSVLETDSVQTKVQSWIPSARSRPRSIPEVGARWSADCNFVIELTRGHIVVCNNISRDPLHIGTLYFIQIFYSTEFRVRLKSMIDITILTELRKRRSVWHVGIQRSVLFSDRISI